MDLTAATSGVASAVVDAARVLPARAGDPVLSGVLLSAGADGLTVSGTDRERTVRLRSAATAHTDGTVLVPGRPLADTLRALDVPEVRLVVEGSRLAVRTPRARFALPLLDRELHPGVPEAPPFAGRATGRALLRGLSATAAAASRDDALPVFTGVRVRALDGVLRLIATDRFRLAVAEVPWSGGELDVLIPAALATEISRQAAGSAELALHADHDRAAVSWPGGEIGTALLAAPFPDERRYLGTTPDATAVLDADELLGAVRRVGLYADGRGAVGVSLADGEVRVRGVGGELGEAEESVKAGVTGRLDQTYRSAYLVDALRVFAGRSVSVELKDGLRSTVFTAAEPEPDGVSVHYVVMPLLPSSRR